MAISISSNLPFRLTVSAVAAALVLIAALALVAVCFVNLLRSLKMQPRALALGMVLGAAAAAGALFVLFSAGREAPLFAPGEGTGEERRYFAGGTSGDLTIRISEEEIWLGDVRCADAGDLSARLSSIERAAIARVTLADDYAAAGVWHETEEALDALGLSWEETALP